MNMGYARISTGEQLLDLPRDALTVASCGSIFTNTLTRAKAIRVGLNEVLPCATLGYIRRNANEKGRLNGIAAPLAPTQNTECPRFDQPRTMQDTARRA
jgi:hypothetical protein